jgi:ribose 5-phosphate isomerase RpiB
MDKIHENVYIAACQGCESFADILFEALLRPSDITEKFGQILNIGASVKYNQDYILEPSKYTSKYVGERLDANISDMRHRGILISGVGMGAGFWSMMAKYELGAPNNIRASIAKSTSHARLLREKYMMNVLCIPADPDAYDQSTITVNHSRYDQAIYEVAAFLRAEPDTSTEAEAIKVMRTIKMMTYANNPKMLAKWKNHPKDMFYAMAR